MEDIVALIGDKKNVKILDVGSGPFSVIGSFLEGINVEITHCDRQDFKDYWEKRQITPIIDVEQQNMENLTYEDESFDIVCCQNALDHTKNAKESVKEMIRVCKKGGSVYIKCWLNQLDTGYLHKWNAKKDGVLDNYKESFDLKDFGFKIESTDGDTRNDNIVAILQK